MSVAQKDMNPMSNDTNDVRPVPLLDLKAQYRTIKGDIEAAIAEVCESQHFVMGPKVVELEQAVAEYSNSAHGIGVSSGTDALLVALMALGVGAGDEVITTTYSFFATGGVVARLGARPIFLDIDATSYNLDPAAVRAFLEANADSGPGGTINKQTGGRIKVLMPVHLYGQTADMTAFEAIAKEYGLATVEDAAQAIGAEDADGRRAGSMSDIGCFSFFPSKNLGAFGDGGMCVAKSDELAESLRILRLHGGKPKYYHSVVGGNFRLDAIQAAVLLVKLKHLDDWTAGRQRNAKIYDELFANASDAVQTPVIGKGCRHIFNQYVIEVDDRDGLQQHLRDLKIGNEIYYPVPLHRQECFADLGYSEGDCPNAERAARRTLALPVYPEATQEQLEIVANAVLNFVAS